MNNLFSAAIDRKDTGVISLFPKELMTTAEEAITSWVIDYCKRHSAFPTKERFQKQFPAYVLFKPPADPITDILEQEITLRKNDTVIRIIAEMENDIREKGEVKEATVAKLNKIMAASSGGLEKYSTFDRESYFRASDGGVTLGLPVIDRAMGGVRRGDFTLIVGRLGAGKTTLLQWIIHRWWQNKRRILFVSNEMLPRDIFARFDGLTGNFNPLMLREAIVSEEIRDRLKFVSHLAGTTGGEIIIPRSRLMTPSSIVGLAKYLEIDAIVIDGIHLMQPDFSFQSKWERVAAVSNALKQGALDMQLPIIGVTQLKRVGHKDEYDAEDIAYSDALGQDADFVLAVRPLEGDKTRSEIQTIKNRYGPTPTVQVHINFETMTIVDETSKVP